MNCVYGNGSPADVGEISKTVTFLQCIDGFRDHAVSARVVYILSATLATATQP